MVTGLTPSQARSRDRAAFDEFWKAYPKKIAPTEAARVFSEIVETGVDPMHLIKKARAYALTVDPTDLKYVPSPHSWLRHGRYDDVDLFANQFEAEKEWLRECWRTVNVKAIENRYHVTFEKQYPPEDMDNPKAIKLWYQEMARAWISQIVEEQILCRESASQPTTLSQNSQSSEPCSTTPETFQTSLG